MKAWGIYMRICNLGIRACKAEVLRVRKQVSIDIRMMSKMATIGIGQ